MHLNYQGSIIHNSQDIVSTKMANDRNMKTMWYFYTLEHYSAIKQNEIMVLAAAWMNQEIITLSEVSQMEKDKHPKILHTGGICKFIGMNECAKQKQTHSLRKPNSDFQEKVRRDR